MLLCSHSIDDDAEEIKDKLPESLPRFRYSGSNTNNVNTTFLKSLYNLLLFYKLHLKCFLKFFFFFLECNFR